MKIRHTSTYTVLVVSETGAAHPVRFGAEGNLQDCLDLSRSLSGGIGRDTINIQTAFGAVAASAMLVQNADGAEVARFIDGKLVA